ncbi:hypothetical protein [Flavilitoribacter nigricans]|uniref:Tetratricopeptide repeat protein n=1 Tax=Flavilitoribacter nigricans (strain ATCC 23147 / DSM 23189 / NBRC 102662 / NCIMB 1420 / SS-2) TaxID=1122177 RepID=A0A2D0MXX5_FLAN2|nr:hypothetical protein [Flavilitoribacter nigricans]PHN01030.1 hypothetical protein CRP01_39180 [Flavilitoribacter nigricans DSM 23189 = NBRC 102662]
MQYQKIVSGKFLIELHNSWSGQESVFVNGQLVSRKGSFWGTNHCFTVQEGGELVRFILTTKVKNGMQVVFDLSRDGKMVAEDVAIPYGSMPEKPHLKLKRSAQKHLQEYELDLALEHLEEAQLLAPTDPELFFHMACAYSVLEQPLKGFECLQRAIELGLQDQSTILSHDMLAYLRMHPAFSDFKASGYSRFGKVFFKKRKEAIEA